MRKRGKKDGVVKHGKKLSNLPGDQTNQQILGRERTLPVGNKRNVQVEKGRT